MACVKSVGTMYTAVAKLNSMVHRDHFSVLKFVKKEVDCENKISWGIVQWFVGEPWCVLE